MRPATAGTTSCPTTSGPCSRPLSPTASCSPPRPRCAGAPRPQCSKTPWPPSPYRMRRPRAGEPVTRSLPRGPLTPAGWTVVGAAVVAYALGAALGYRFLAACGVGLAALLVLGAAWIVLRPRVDLARTLDPDRVAV